MKYIYFFLLALTLSGSASAQSFISKVVQNGTFTYKFDASFEFTETHVKTNNQGQEYDYEIMESPMPGTYRVGQPELYWTYIVSEVKPGKLKGFRYTHVINISCSDPSVSPEFNYLCQLVE